uniref:Uncharacterized protein n=1 Tax=Palpitomonas bilix TaxID=652834 RepID=A0A7S3D0D0_9EUKA|mmetsp:Transcript_16734/g.42014  ORF Transcript_16734/g.42014 Transcript_16734/m.42014 type:complete len:461 (+) Transcript_16734:218-1600(+)
MAINVQEHVERLLSDDVQVKLFEEQVLAPREPDKVRCLILDDSFDDSIQRQEFQRKLATYIGDVNAAKLDVRTWKSKASASEFGCFLIFVDLVKSLHKEEQLAEAVTRSKQDGDHNVLLHYMEMGAAAEPEAAREELLELSVFPMHIAPLIRSNTDTLTLNLWESDVATRVSHLLLDYFNVETKKIDLDFVFISAVRSPWHGSEHILLWRSLSIACGITFLLCSSSPRALRIHCELESTTRVILMKHGGIMGPIQGLVLVGRIAMSTYFQHLQKMEDTVLHWIQSTKNAFQQGMEMDDARREIMVDRDMNVEIEGFQHGGVSTYHFLESSSLGTDDQFIHACFQSLIYDDAQMLAFVEGYIRMVGGEALAQIMPIAGDRIEDVQGGPGPGVRLQMRMILGDLLLNVYNKWYGSHFQHPRKAEQVWESMRESVNKDSVLWKCILGPNREAARKSGNVYVHF